MRLLIALLVWAAAVVAAVEVSSAVAGSIHPSPKTAAVGSGGTGASSSSNGSSGSSDSSGAASVDPSSVKSTDSVSMFRQANFSRALGAARKQLGSNAKVDNFVIYPGYLSITAVKGNSATELYIDVNGRVISSSGGSPGLEGVFPLSKVSPAAPPALVKRIASLAHVPGSQLHYMVAEVDPVAHTFRWLVYAVPSSKAEYFATRGVGAPLFEYRKGSSTGLQRVSG